MDIDADTLAAHRAGAEAWPTCELAVATFAEHLARARRDAAAAPTHATDLYLACAAACGEVHAIAEVARQIRALVPSVVGRMRAGDAFAEEVLQMMLEKLLVARPDAPPRIAEYRGTGPLGGWLRVSIVRVALRARDTLRRHEPAEGDVDDARAPTLSPETAIVRRDYVPAFAAALREAIAKLDGRPREILRMHHAEGRSIDALAAHYGVHRATAARWVVAARLAVIAETKRLAQERLAVGDDELASLMHVVVSQLDLSMSRLR